MCHSAMCNSAMCHSAMCHSAMCHSAMCHSMSLCYVSLYVTLLCVTLLSIFLICGTMLCVTQLNIILICGTMLNVIIPGVILLNAVAPIIHCQRVHSSMSPKNLYNAMIIFRKQVRHFWSSFFPFLRVFSTFSLIFSRKKAGIWTLDLLFRSGKLCHWCL